MQRKLIVKYAAIAIVVFAVSFGLGTLVTQQIMQYGILGMLSNTLTGSSTLDGERVNILIIGQDARPNEKVTRSDTMIVASIDPKLKKAVLLWIPRDTKWESNKYGTQKINASNSFGGPELCRDALEELLDIKIDYYVQLNFDAFRKVVDELGGVEINVEQRLYHEDPENPELEIDLDPGVQTLNGKDSLAYVRYRSYPMGDMDRDTHQAIFVKALAAKALSPITVLKVPEIIMTVRENLVTDMTASDMARYATWAPSFKSDDIITQTLPGFYENGYNSSGDLIWCYWKPDEDLVHKILDNLFAGKKYEVYDQSAEDDYNSSNSYSGDDSDSDSKSSQDETETDKPGKTGTDGKDSSSQTSTNSDSQNASHSQSNTNSTPDPAVSQPSDNQNHSSSNSTNPSR